MEETVWSFENVTLRHRRCIVLLVRWSDFAEAVTVEIERHAEKFGEFMESKGVLVMPYRHKMRESFAEVVDKGWPEAVRARIEATKFPFLLIIKEDFRDFSPARHRSAIVWFEDFEEKPEEVWKVLDSLATRVVRDEDVFDWLTEVEARARRSELARKAGEASRYIDVDIPILPGVVSIKAGAIWADVMKRLA
jgi:hypothetical protein